MALSVFNLQMDLGSMLKFLRFSEGMITPLLDFLKSLRGPQNKTIMKEKHFRLWMKPFLPDLMTSLISSYSFHTLFFMNKTVNTFTVHEG